MPRIIGVEIPGEKRIDVALQFARNLRAGWHLRIPPWNHQVRDAYPDRFLLGIGVSHAPLVTMRGHAYEKPLTAMRRYLDAMDSAMFTADRVSSTGVSVSGQCS